MNGYQIPALALLYGGPHDGHSEYLTNERTIEIHIPEFKPNSWAFDGEKAIGYDRYVLDDERSDSERKVFDYKGYVSFFNT